MTTPINQSVSPRRGTAETIANLTVWVSRPARLCWIAGTTLLKFAAVTSGFLVAHHFGARLPGCGPAAGCETLQSSEWGVVPGLGWPIAFVGIAYFLGMMAAFAFSHRGVTPLLRVLAWAGALASLSFVSLMIYLEEFCVYCALTHALNLAFVGFMELYIALERRRRAAGAPTMAMTTNEHVQRALGVLGRVRPFAAFAVVFAATSAALGVAAAMHDAKQAKSDEAQRADSTQRIIAKSAEDASEQPVDRWGAAGFTGRYRKGPAEAAIRIVVLTDYQCPDCRRVEGEIDQILAARKDTSFSVKHFPMCTDCNKHAGRTLHENACWAARAAEAAGILGGDAAFFKMHAWLFEKKGTFFNTSDLEPIAKEMGIDVGTLATVMQSPQTLKNVEADVEDGMALGLYSTPMVFINGVEFKGWQVVGALTKTVMQVAATNPAPRTAAADHPVLAAQRYIDDWKEQPPLPHLVDKRSWWRGLAPEGAPPGGEKLVEIVVYGDYQEINTVNVDKQITEAMQGRANVRYMFRQYPVSPSCNAALPPGVPASVIHPQACTAARAAEAAGALGGNDAYWKMHDWLMAHMNGVTDASVEEAVRLFGWDVARFKALLQTPNISDAIKEDCEAARTLGLTSIPFVLVNDKRVPRALRDGDNVLKRIVEEASKR